VKSIPLTQGKVALVDDEDYDRIAPFKWQAQKPGKNRSWRARRGVYDPVSQNNVSLYLHNAVMNPAPGVMVDHENGDGLDNQKHNLRFCTKLQNNQAFRKKSPGKSSQYRGVFWYSQASAWHARIECKGRRYHLGTFKTEVEAARAYDAAAKLHFGEFASPNFKL
jgi:hypothetical protein